MFKSKKLAKIFIYLFVALMLMACGLMAAHVYCGGDNFGSVRTHFPPAARFIEPQKSEFSVALMSDTAANNRVLAGVIDAARTDGADYSFFMYLGDMVDDTSPVNFRWMMAKIQPTLGDMPFYTLPGNHDVEKHHVVDKTGYNSVMGPGYYWFGYGDVLFIVMDSSGKYVEDVQFEWLRETLENVRPRFGHCVIFGHKPPVNPVNAPNHKMDAASVDKFAGIIAGHKIDAMFFGHVHYFSREVFNGVPVYTTPAAGQEPRLDINKYGYISLKIGRDGVMSVEPKYIEFSGRPRNHFSEWWADHIFSRKARKIVGIVLVAALGCLAVGMTVNRAAKNK